MRTFLSICLVTVFMATGIALAQPGPRGHMQGGMMGEGMPMMQGQKGGCPMMGMAMPKVIPTDDGGVIVISGTKMVKYDKNLEKKKEVTIPIDTAGVGQMMRMMPNCPAAQPDTTSDSDE